MKKISIINQKGGSGKTSFSVLCCLALAQRGFKVLAIDADPQGGMTDFLCPHYSDDTLITSVLLGNVVLPEKSDYDNIFIIPSDYTLDKMYVTIDHMAFKRALKNVDAFDYIIFDTPPTMQGITRAAIHVSDKIFIPCELSKSALNPTLYTLDCLAELEKCGEVVFVDKENSKHKENIRLEFTSKLFPQLNSGKVSTIRRDIASQKIISGECRLTEDKIKKYLNPVYGILEG
jgi:chromosome partitioning protein